MKLKCQEASVEDEDDEEEYDALLIETAGDLIPCLATVSPTEKFNSFLQTTMPIFLKKHVSESFMLVLIIAKKIILFCLS